MYQAALVLEGGAMRGQYTAGVLDVFLEQGLFFKQVIGVSAGALSGVNYVSRQQGRTNEINVNYREEKEYISLKNLVKYDGIINLDFLFSDHGGDWEVFDNATYEKSATMFTIVATALKDGRPLYFNHPRGKALVETLKASSSLPLISAPQKTPQGLCLDGGIADSLPYAYAQAQGFKKIVVIRTQDRHYRKKPTSSMTAKVYQRAYKKYPAFAQQAIDRPLHYNQQVDELARLEVSGQAFVIAPQEPVTVKRLEKDAEKLRALYQTGRQEASALLPVLQEYLS